MKKTLLFISMSCLGVVFMAGCDTNTDRGTRLMIYAVVAAVCLIVNQIIFLIEGEK